MYPQPGREHYGVFVHESVLAMRARGHELLVVAPLPTPPPGLSRLRPEWRRLAAIPARRMMDGLTVLHPRYLLLPRRLAFASAAAAMAGAVLELDLPGDLDLIHAHAGVPDGGAARRVAAALHLPFVVTSHGSDVLRAAAWSPAVHAELHDAFHEATATIFPSRRARERARAIGLPIEGGHVIWNGHRRDLFATAPKGETPAGGPLRVIAVANLVPSKGVDLLIEALAQLAVEGRPMEFHLIGDGTERRRLMALAADRGLAMRWDPRLERGGLASALGAADCFALPAGDESFGIVYLEAMACGLPVIALADEGIADIVRQGREGLLLGDRSVASLKRALATLQDDPVLRRRMGKAAWERASGLGWEHQAENLESLYRECLETPEPAPRERIFHLLYNSDPDRNGYAIRSRYILATQRELGWEVQAATSPFQQARWGNGPRESREGLRYHRLDLPGTCRKRGRLGWRRFWVFLQKALADRLLEHRAAMILHRERPALLHAHSPAFNLNLARRAARRAGQSALPLVYEVRGLTEETESLVGNARAGGLLYRLKRRLEEKAMLRADAVVALSAGMREDFIARGIPVEKLFVMPNGVDVAAIPPAERNEQRAAELGLSAGRTLGFIGSMGRLEGLPWLVERLAELPADWKLILVGDGQDRATTLALAEALGLSGRFIAPGSVPHEEVGDWYGLLDYVVLPRPSLRVTELVTPLKPLEAMAAGRVVLASDIGGHREIIEDGHNGFLFDRNEPAAFHGRLQALAADPTARERLQTTARHWVETERDWRRLVAGYAGIYAAAARNAAAR